MARPGNLTWHAAALPSLPPARGFTLIELMVTLAILALLLMVAAPMATDWASGTRTHQGRATLVQAYSQAKALALSFWQAIKQSQETTFAAGPDAIATSRTPAQQRAL